MIMQQLIDDQYLFMKTINLPKEVVKGSYRNKQRYIAQKGCPSTEGEASLYIDYIYVRLARSASPPYVFRIYVLAVTKSFFHILLRLCSRTTINDSMLQFQHQHNEFANTFLIFPTYILLNKYRHHVFFH